MAFLSRSEQPNTVRVGSLDRALAFLHGNPIVDRNGKPHILVREQHVKFYTGQPEFGEIVVSAYRRIAQALVNLDKKRIAVSYSSLLDEVCIVADQLYPDVFRTEIIRRLNDQFFPELFGGRREKPLVFGNLTCLFRDGKIFIDDGNHRMRAFAGFVEFYLPIESVILGPKHDIWMHLGNGQAIHEIEYGSWDTAFAESVRRLVGKVGSNWNGFSPSFQKHMIDGVPVPF